MLKGQPKKCKQWEEKQLIRKSQCLVGEELEKHIEKISKDEALKKMKELKEFLDLTVISQEEFDKKSKRLKEIILGE